MSPAPPSPTHRRCPLAALLGAAVLGLVACGGGADDPPAPAADGCSTTEHKAWLGDYMREWYFWNRFSPDPDPIGFPSAERYFDALLYRGGDPAFPPDRWSRTEPTESFNRYYGEGRTLGYGLAVAGIEVAGQPGRPLRVRHVEPRSSAAAQGVRRGDEVLSLNGRAAAELIAADDFSALTADREGQVLSAVLRGAGGVPRSVALTATVFDVTPVGGAAVLDTPLGRRIGYVMVKDMIEQARAPLAQAFAQFHAEAVNDVVLDLRYNGGGLVSVAATVAAHAVGARVGHAPFARLLYNDRRAAASNQTFFFGQPAPALGLPRVIVLAGPRTCSASEQVINGLRPYAEVVVIGEATCGKPVGFLPASRCGTTYSAVNFESVNARDEGRYFLGFAPSCTVADDLSRPLGDPAEAMLDAARRYADSGSCPAADARRSPLSARPAPPRARDGDSRQDMIPR